MKKLLYQGAEAKILLDEKRNIIIKDRIKKSYRIKELDDKIIKHRTKSEKKLLEKATKIINAPNPILLKEKQFNIIQMPYIEGKKLSEHLDNFPLEKQKEILKVVGEETAKLHDNDIIHGDLTTSNLILVEREKIPAHSPSQMDKIDSDKQLSKVVSKLSNNKLSSEASVYFIDFGLGFISKKVEDKAVDLHLIKQALEAKHFKNWEVLFDEFLKGYNISKEAKQVFERLKAVEKRGRYRH